MSARRQATDRRSVCAWPGDFDAAFAWLVVQPGVDRSRIGAGGGSCGVNNAVKLASRHPEVRSLVLLARGTDTAGVKYLEDNPWVPIFSAAAADDEFDQFKAALRQGAEHKIEKLNAKPFGQAPGRR